MKSVKYLCFILFLSACIHDNSETENYNFQDDRTEVNYNAADYYVNYDSNGNEHSNLFSNLNSSISRDLQSTISKNNFSKDDENKAYDNIYFGISPREYKALENNYRIKIDKESYAVIPTFHNEQLFNLSIEIPENDVDFVLNIIERKFGKPSYDKYENEEFVELNSESYSWTTKTKKIILSRSVVFNCKLNMTFIPLSLENAKAIKKLEQEQVKKISDKF